MKSWKHLLTGALAMAILAGCGNDEPVEIGRAHV